MARRPQAAAARSAEIAAGLAGSFTLGGGQFCTKPGLVFVPTSADGDRLVAELATAVCEVAAPVLLNERIAGSYAQHTAGLVRDPRVVTVARGAEASGEGFAATPLLLSVEAAQLGDLGVGEVFGPVTVLARYRGEDDLVAGLESLPASLTFTLIAEESDTAWAGRLLGLMRPRAGRFLMNGWPTGVAVSWAQHHGGPWPSTNTEHTSVGTTAIRRFLRPVAYQSVPAGLLPPELRDGETGLPRRVDGVLVTSA